MSIPNAPTSQNDDATVLQRVRKLMDKAAATTHPHEADAFATKAAQLVAQHRIDPARLAARRSDARLVVREIELGRGAYVRGRLALLTAVADSHDATVVFGSTPNGTIAYVAGFASDVDVIEVMYHSLHGQAAAAMAERRRSTGSATQRYRRSFLFGYADRIGELLAETRRTVEQMTPAVEQSEVALALRERRDEVDEFARRQFGRTRRARQAGGAEAVGWVAGAAAADRADVGRRGVGGRRAIENR